MVYQSVKFVVLYYLKIPEEGDRIKNLRNVEFNYGVLLLKQFNKKSQVNGSKRPSAS